MVKSINNIKIIHNTRKDDLQQMQREEVITINELPQVTKENRIIWI